MIEAGDWRRLNEFTKVEQDVVRLAQGEFRCRVYVWNTGMSEAEAKSSCRDDNREVSGIAFT